MNAPVVGASLAPSIAVTLEVLAAEIELAGARCILLDRLVGEMMDNLPPDQRTRMLDGMHSVDLLAQHLTGLSAFARTVSATAPPEAVAPVDVALSEITLGALAERMTAGLGGVDDDSRELPDDDGDVDLF
jgi:hypothetical protein